MKKRNREDEDRPRKPRFTSVKTHACVHCGAKFDENLAKCTSCGKWNTGGVAPNASDETKLLSDVSSRAVEVIKTGPWDPCFSTAGGIVNTSVTLLGGAPGAGKSTLSLQLCDTVAGALNREVLFVAKEQAEEEVKLHAERIGTLHSHLIRVFPMGATGDLGPIMLARKPCATIIDSMPGFAQNHDEAVKVAKFAKEYAVQLKMPVIIIDHVTKDGDMAGLMALQHEVDTLITIFPIEGGEPELREMITHKNRFGPAFKPVHLLMTEKGLVGYHKPSDEDEDD